MEYFNNWPLWKYTVLKEMSNKGYGIYYYNVDTDEIINEKESLSFEKLPYKKSDTYKIVGLSKTINSAYKDINNKIIPTIPQNIKDTILQNQHKDPLVSKLLGYNKQHEHENKRYKTHIQCNSHNSHKSYKLNNKMNDILNNRLNIVNNIVDSNNVNNVNNVDNVDNGTDSIEEDKSQATDEENPKSVKKGDVGTRYFSTNYGRGRWTGFEVFEVNKTGKKMLIKFDDNDEFVWFDWRRPGKWIPQGTKAKDYKNYHIEIGERKTGCEEGMF